MFPCSSEQETREGKKARQWSEQNKFTTSHLRHDMAGVKNERLCPSISDPSQTAAIPVHGLGHSRAAAAAKSVCHMFFLPSRLMCLLTFSALSRFPGFVQSFFRFFLWIPQKSFGAVCLLIFVWSIQSCVFLFFSLFPARRNNIFLQDSSAIRKKSSIQQEGEVCKLFRHTKKRKKFCHVVLLFLCFLIMEQNAEIPFAKAISKHSDNVGHSRAANWRHSRGD